MSATFKISEKEYVAAYKLYDRFPKNRAFVYLGLIVLILVFYWFRCVHWLSQISLYGAIGAFIGLSISEIITRQFVGPYQVKKQYRAYKAAHQPSSIEIRDEGVYFSSVDANGLLRWANVFKWRENNEFILLYQNSEVYHIVPKAIENDTFRVDDLIDKLIEYVGKST